MRQKWLQGSSACTDVLCMVLKILTPALGGYFSRAKPPEKMSIIRSDKGRDLLLIISQWYRFCSSEGTDLIWEAEEP